MIYSVNRPAPGHAFRIGAPTLGTRPIRGFNTPFKGTSARCECGWTWKTNERPPSRGGQALANEAYRHHLKPLEVQP